MDTRDLEQAAANAASHDTDVPKALVEFMGGGWTDVQPVASVHPQAGRFQARRAALSRAFPGEYVAVPAGGEQVRANDTNFRYRTGTDFAYLVGPGEPGALLVLEPDGREHRPILFVQPHNRGTKEFFSDRVRGELWVGRHRGIAESAQHYGIADCRSIDEAATYLQSVRAAKHAMRVLPDDATLATHLSEMRLLKDAYELDELRKAVTITKRGFEDVIRIMQSAGGEREIEAAFWRRARIEANDVGYLTIAAAGHHACTLHWNRNDGALDRNALLLLDAGVECDSLYTADVTRTLPIGGRFSGEQRAVYDIVYAAQRAGIEAVKPGNDFLEPNHRAMRVLAEGLMELGLLESAEDALHPEHQYYRRYTLHNVSHMLGIDVHDCAKARAETYRYGTLREGMVLTVEPGLYFQPDDATVPERFRGIGVRIEDDVAVTATGYENFSAILPSRVDEVETWISTLSSAGRR